MQKITLQEKRDLDTLFNVLYVKKQSKFIEFYKSVFKKIFDIFKR